MDFASGSRYFLNQPSTTTTHARSILPSASAAIRGRGVAAAGSHGFIVTGKNSDPWARVALACNWLQASGWKGEPYHAHVRRNIIAAYLELIIRRSAFLPPCLLASHGFSIGRDMIWRSLSMHRNADMRWCLYHIGNLGTILPLLLVQSQITEKTSHSDIVLLKRKPTLSRGAENGKQQS